MEGPINLSVVHRGHVEFLRRAEALLKSELWKAGSVALRSVKTTTKFKRRKIGNSLKDATRIKVSGGSRKLTLRVSSHKRYAPFVEFATRPHVITARRKKTLRFFGKDGKPVFRRRVFHPGTKSTYFLRTATNEAYASFGERVRYKMGRQRFRFR